MPLVFRDAGLGSAIINLFLYKGGEDKARANGVTSNAPIGIFKGHYFRDPDDTVLGRDIGRFVDGGDKTVY